MCRRNKFFSLFPEDGVQVYGAATPTLRKGDVIGCLFDADVGVMYFTVNGNSMGEAFTEQMHGNLADGGDLIPGRYGPNWDSGFYPTITLGVSQSVKLNLGQEKFRYMPTGYVGLNRSDRMENNHVFPYCVERFDNISNGWVDTRYGRQEPFEIQSEDGYYCSLSPSMRVTLEVPVKTVKGVEVESFCSVASFTPHKWMHCVVKVGNDNSVTFVVNGNSEIPVKSENAFLSHKGHMAVGVIPDQYSPSVVPSSNVWIADLVYKEGLFDAYDSLISNLPVNEEAVHFVRSTLNGNKNAQVAFSNMVNLRRDQVGMLLNNQELEDVFVMSFEIILAIADDDILIQILGLDGVLFTIDKLLLFLEECSSNNLASKSASRALEILTIISSTSVGCACLVRLDAVVRVLAVLSDRGVSKRMGEAFFWAELFISNMHVPPRNLTRRLDGHIDNILKVADPKQLYYKRISDLKEADMLLMRQRVYPFSPFAKTPSVWRRMPVAVWTLHQDPQLFADIIRRLIAVREDPRLPLTLPRENVDKLGMWVVQAFSFISMKNVYPSKTVQEIESQHPYTAAIGHINLESQVNRTQLVFDKQCETLIGDTLTFYEDADRQIPLLDPATGKHCMYNGPMHRWPSSFVINDQAHIYWSFVTTSLSNNTHWGFKVDVICEVLGLGDTKDVCQDLNSEGAIEMLFSMASGGPEHCRQNAATALLYLMKHNDIPQFTPGVVEEALISLFVSTRYDVLPTSGLAVDLDSHLEELGLSNLIPCGTIVTVDRRKKIENRSCLHVVEPREYAGWVFERDARDIQQLAATSLEHGTLRLIGFMALQKPFRSELVRRSNFSALLQLLQANDVQCTRAFAMAVDEISSDPYLWSTASSVFEVELENFDFKMPMLYSTYTLERMPCSNYYCGLPSFSGIPEVGMVVQKRNNYVASASCKQVDYTTGVVTDVLATKYQIRWGPEDSTAFEYMDFKSNYVNVIRDKNKAILSYGSQGMSCMPAKDICLGSDIVLSVRENEQSEPIAELTDLDQCNFPIVSTTNHCFLEIGLKGDRGIDAARMSSLKLYVAPLPDLEYFESPSYEVDVFHALITLLDSPDDETRASALSAIGKLCNCYECHDENDTFYKKKWTALRKRIVNSSALDLIIRLTTDEKSGLVAREAWKVIEKIFPNMDSLLEITHDLMKQSSTDNNSSLMSCRKTFVAAYSFRLVYSQYHPLFNRANLQPISLSTALYSNNESFPCPVFETDRNHQKIMLDKNAVSVAIKFHPRSNLREHESLRIFNETGINGLVLNNASIQGFIRQGNVVCVERQRGMTSFNMNLIAGEMEKERNDDRSSGFAVTAVQEYPHFEKYVRIGPRYKKNWNQLAGKESKHYETVVFYMASCIEVVFDSNCNTQTGDCLIIYQEKSDFSGFEEVARYHGSKWNISRLMVIGDRLRYEFDVKSDNIVAGDIGFHLRPHFETIESTQTIKSNINSLLPTGLQDSGNKAIQFLLSLIRENSILTRQWASMAYAQIASHAKDCDPYGNYRIENDNKDTSYSHVLTKEINFNQTPVEFLYRKGAGIGEASRMIGDVDMTVRKQGCTALVYFSQCKGATKTMIKENTWRKLLNICVEYSKSNNAVEVDSVRNSIYLVSKLLSQPDTHDSINSTIFLEPLIACLGSHDHLTKFYSAKALFQLSEMASNHDKIIETGLGTLVTIATKAIDWSSDNAHDESLLQQGAAMVLCMLITRSVNVKNVIKALRSRVEDAFELMLNEIMAKMEINNAVQCKDTLIIVLESMERICQSYNDETVFKLVGDKIRKWEKLLEIFTSCVRRAAGIDEFLVTILPVADKYIKLCFFLIDEQRMLHFSALKALIEIAGCCWATHGKAIFKKLVDITNGSNNSMFADLTDTLYFKSFCLLPIMKILCEVPVDMGTAIILDFLRLTNLLLVCNNEDEQFSILNEIFLFLVEYDDQWDDPKSNASHLLAFKLSEIAVGNFCMCISLNSSPFRPLNEFYYCESRESICNYVHFSFYLWDWLLAHNNTEFGKIALHYLPFKQLLEYMEWPNNRRQHISYMKYSDVFSDLMLHLYVCNINCVENGSLDKVFKIDAKFSVAQELIQSEKNDLIFFMNRFLGGGRGIMGRGNFGATCHDDYDLLAIMNSQSLDIGDCTRTYSLLKLLMGMVIAGFYDDASDFIYLKDSLLKLTAELANSYITHPKAGDATSKMDKNKIAAKSPFRRSFLVKVESLLLEALELCMNLDLRLQNKEYHAVKRVSCDRFFQNASGESDVLPMQLFEMLLINSDINSASVQIGMRVCSSKAYLPFFDSDRDSRHSHKNYNETPVEGIVTAMDDEFVTVTWDFYFFPDYFHPPNKKEIEVFRRENHPGKGESLYVIQFPRLQAMLRGSHIVMHEYACSNLGFHIGQKDSTLAGLSTKLYLQMHNSLQLFHSSSQSLKFLSSEKNPDSCYYKLLQSELSFLRKVKLDMSLAVNPALRQSIAKSIDRLRYAMEGRTEGALLSLNMILVPGPDFGLNRKRDDLQYQVIGIKSLRSGDSGLELDTRMKGSTVEYSFLFSDNHIFELALPSPVREVYQRRQEISAACDLLPTIMHIFQQREQLREADETLANEFHDIFKACCRLLNSFTKGNDENTALMCSPGIAYSLSSLLGRIEEATPIIAVASKNISLHHSISPTFISNICNSIHNMIFSGSELASSSLSILNNILPDLFDSDQSNSAEQKRKISLMQSLIVKGLFHDVSNLVDLFTHNTLDLAVNICEFQKNNGNYLDEDFIQQVEWSKSKVCTSFLSILGKCIRDNDKMISLIFKKFKESTNSHQMDIIKGLVGLFISISKGSFGYQDRAQVMLPWLEFLSSLCDQFSVDPQIYRDLATEVLDFDVPRYFHYTSPLRTSDAIVVETCHPFQSDGLDVLYEAEVPDAEAVKVWFSSNTELYSDDFLPRNENEVPNFDYLEISSRQLSEGDENLYFKALYDINLPKGEALETSTRRTSVGHDFSARIKIGDDSHTRKHSQDKATSAMKSADISSGGEHIGILLEGGEIEMGAVKQSDRMSMYSAPDSHSEEKIEKSEDHDCNSVIINDYYKEKCGDECADVFIPKGTIISVQRSQLKWETVPTTGNGGYYVGMITSPPHLSGVWISVVNGWEACDVCGRTRNWFPFTCSGGQFPRLGNELYLKGSKVSVRLHSDGLNATWGFKMFVQACSDTEVEALGFESNHQFESSLHDPSVQVFQFADVILLDGKNTLQKISFEEENMSEDGLQIIFDANSRIDKNVSHVSFYVDEWCTEPIVSDRGQSQARFSGRKGDNNWPGVGDRKPLFVPHSSFYCLYVRNPGSDLGVRFSVSPASEPLSDMDLIMRNSPSKVFESTHFGGDSTLDRIPMKESPVDVEITTSFLDKFYFIDSSGDLSALETTVPLGARVRLSSVLVYHTRQDRKNSREKVADVKDGEVFCRVSTRTDLRSVFAFGPPVWNEATSNPDLIIDGPVIHRSNRELAYPAALFKITDPVWQSSFRITDTPAHNSFSIGIGDHSFPLSDSGGFGLFRNSYGISSTKNTARSKGSNRAVCSTAAYSNRKPMKDVRFPAVDGPTVITLQCDLSQGWLDIVMRKDSREGDIDVYRHRFEIDTTHCRYDEFVAGVIVSDDQTIVIEPFNDVNNNGRIEKNVFMSSKFLSYSTPVEEIHEISMPGDGLVVKMDVPERDMMKNLGRKGSLSIYSKASKPDESLLYDSNKDFVYPSKNDPIIVTINKLYVKYTRYFPFTYGFKMTVYSSKIKHNPFKLFSRDRRKFRILQRPRKGTTGASYTESVKIEGAYGLVIIFDKNTFSPSEDSFVEFRKVNAHEGLWSSTGDEDVSKRKCFGGINGLDNLFPGVGEVPPMIIPSNHFVFHFHNECKASSNWRVIIFDQSLLELTSPEKHVTCDADSHRSQSNNSHMARGLKSHNTFFFFENKSSEVQTIKLDMPIMEDIAYFEFVLGTKSTLTSYSQVGCVVGDEERVLRHQNPHGQLPVCLGLGGVIGSYALSSCETAASGKFTPTMRFSRNADSNRPFQAVEFREGTVIGVEIDVSEGKIDYFINGEVCTPSPAFSCGAGISWKRMGGLCPAFSFCPGQRVSVNVGQVPFFTSQYASFNFSSVLDSYVTSSSGLAHVWSTSKNCWKLVTPNSMVLENSESDIVKSYTRFLKHFIESVLVKDRADTFQRYESLIHQGENKTKALVKKEADTNTNASRNSTSYSKVRFWEPQMNNYTVSYSDDLSMAGFSSFENMAPEKLLARWVKSHSNSNTPRIDSTYNSPRKLRVKSEDDVATKPVFAIMPSSCCQLSVVIKRSDEEYERYRNSASEGFAMDDSGINISFGIVSIDEYAGLTEFGVSPQSYGIFHSDSSLGTPSYVGCNVDDICTCVTASRALSYDDVLSLFLCVNTGTLYIGLNDGELVHKFQVPKNKAYVLGATVSRRHNVSTFLGIPPRFMATVLADTSLHSVGSGRQQEKLRLIDVAMCSLLTQMCQQRLRSHKKAYINENKNFVDYTSKDSAELPDAIHFGKGMQRGLWEEIKKIFTSDSDEKVPWLCLPSGDLPIFLEQQFQDLGITELFDDKWLLLCWRNMINHKLGLKYEPYPLDKGKDTVLTGKRPLAGEMRIFPESIADPKNQIDVKQHLASIINSAIESIVRPSDKDYDHAHFVIKFMRALALYVDKTISKKRKGKKKVITKQSVSFSKKTEETFGDEVEYQGFEESETLLIIQACLGQLGVVTLCCHLLADMDVSRHILIDTLLLCNFLLMNAINQQEDKGTSETNIQNMFMEAIRGNANRNPIQVGTAINRRLAGLRQEVMGLKGVEQTHVLYISKQILLFVQRMCGK